MKKYSVWYISKYISPPTENSIGGRGFLLMKELSKINYILTIITSNSSELWQTPQMTAKYQKKNYYGIDFWWIKTIQYKGSRSFSRILSWLHFEYRLLRMPKTNLVKPDVIIVSSLSLLTIVNGFILRRKFRCKLIFEVRDIWPLTIIEIGKYSKFNPFIIVLGLIEKWGYKYSDKIVGTMPNLQAHVEATLGYKKDVECIPMGVDENSLKINTSIDEGYKKKYFCNDSFTVAYAGTIGTNNSLDTFFKCAELLKKNNDIHFLVIGDGRLKSYFKEKYESYSNITFVPPVQKNDVQSVLTNCDLLYFSASQSKTWEFGQSLNKLIDYMLAAKPIVASYNGFPSMINEAKCGSFIPQDNSNALKQEILNYFNKTNIAREEIGQRGRDWILKNRKFKILAREYSKIICNLI